MDLVALLSTTLIAAGGYPLDIHISPDAAIEEAIEKYKKDESSYIKDEDGEWVFLV